MNKLILVIAVALISACGANEIRLEDAKVAKPAAIANMNNAQNLLTFKVNGEEVRTTCWSISRFIWNSNIARILLNITSNMHDDKRTINVNLGGSATGNYPLTENGPLNKTSYGSYYPDYTGDRLNSYSFTTGAFELTEVDTVKNRVNGRFYGKVKNIKGDSLEITEGRIINGFLKVDITNY